MSSHALRYYESIGLLRNIARDGKNKRNYTEDNVKWIRFLISLRNTGMPLSDIIRYAGMYYSGDHSIPKRIELLSSYRYKLAEEAKQLHASMDFLQKKIEFYNHKLSSIQNNQDGCL